MAVMAGTVTQIRGRQPECARLDLMLGRADAGQGAAVVLRGDAGMGKSALLEHVARRGEGCRIVRAAGVESERDLPFAALHQLCAPLLDGLERLPVPQRDALATAFGLSSGPEAEVLVVGLAVLGLLAGAAETRPLVCLVDDVQWLDRSSAQMLSFVARRLPTGSVVIVFAARDDGGFDALAGLPQLPLQPLWDVEARALFASAHPGPLDERVRDRMIVEARGNPGALLESALGLSAAGLAGGYAVPDVAPLPALVEATYRQQVRRLPPETQRLLLVAAAEPAGDPTLFWPAAGALGIPIAAAAPAEAEGLIAFGPRVTFCHPVLRSAIYHGAPWEERCAAHRALAGAIDPVIDPDRHVWHSALAAITPDEALAALLEGSAGQAQRRGGMAAAAAFLEQSTRLTSEPVRQGERALAAAHARHQAGEPDAAMALLALTRARPLNDVQRARADLLDAHIAFEGALLGGRMARTADLMEVAQAVRAAFSASTPPGPPDSLLDGVARLVTEGYEAGTPILRQALNTFRSRDLSTEGGRRWLWLAGLIAVVLWDQDTLHAIATGTGRMGEGGSLIEAALGDGVSRSGGLGTAMSSYRAALLSNGLGRYAEACVAAERVCQYDDLALAGLGLTELVEAAARTGQDELAGAALRQLQQHMGSAGTDWARGIEARSRALLSDADVAEGLYQLAIDRLGRTRLPTELARAHLLYGEWLRRQNRRVDAHGHLRAAHQLFTSSGAQEFADRAGRELVATGETVRSRRDDTRYDLTAQETEIARLASQGKTNPEIGAQLFVSARTVEWHLRKVFAKLSISSRKELRRALEDGRVALQVA